MDPASLFGHIPGLPIPRNMTIGAARNEQQQRATQLFKHFHRLQAILDRHEATIQKRWVKKKPEQRRNMLKIVWPQISTKHRPDWAAYRRETAQQRHASGTAYRSAYLWPYLNLEDLANPRALLLLLKSRGRNSPETFATLDCESIQFAFTSQAVMPAFLNHHTALLRGSTSKEYGRIYSWEEHEDAFDWLMSRVGMSPGECLIVLEIEEFLLDFLVNCCERILHDIPSERLLQTDPMPEPGLEVEDPSEWQRLGTIRLEKPYQLPGNLEFDRLHAMIRGRINDAHDHIHSLQEDPGYFANFVSDWSVHRQENLPDTHGEKHPAFKRHQTSANKIYWDRVLGSVMANAFNGVFLWQTADRLLLEFQAIAQKHASNLKPGDALPDAIVQPFRNLKRFLLHMRQTYGLNLKMGFTAAPELRKYFVRDPQIPNSPMINVSRKGSEKNDLIDLFAMLQDSDTTHQAGFSNVMDEMQRLIDTDNTYHNQVSSWLAMIFGELAMVGELTRQLDSFEPWASQIEASSSEERSKLTDQSVTRYLEPFAKWMPAMQSAELGQAYFLDDHKFDYPAERKRSEKVVLRMRESEKNLDDFWAKFDEGFRQRGASWQNAFKDFVGKRSVQRTSLWAPREQNNGPGQSNEAIDAKLSILELEHRTESTISKEDPQVPKQKQKTKGSPDDSKSANAVVAAETSNEEVSNVTYPVGKRAFRVFSSLFYDPDVSDAPGELPWTDFLSAMSSLGFRIEKLYGSAWQFTPTKLDVERSIQFHEPHPVAKVTPWLARRIGRRLSRSYGWTNKTFVRKSETAQADS